MEDEHVHCVMAMKPARMARLKAQNCQEVKMGAALEPEDMSIGMRGQESDSWLSGDGRF
jgi:hypothetical protein